MKYLLIIFSILLLSSPVIGQETGVLYRLWDGKIVVWKTFGDDDVNKKWGTKWSWYFDFPLWR